MTGPMTLTMIRIWRAEMNKNLIIEHVLMASGIFLIGVGVGGALFGCKCEECLDDICEEEPETSKLPVFNEYNDGTNTYGYLEGSQESNEPNYIYNSSLYGSDALLDVMRKNGYITRDGDGHLKYVPGEKDRIEWEPSPLDDVNVGDPIVISEDEFEENKWNFEQDTLWWYDEDGYLTDDNDEVLINKEYYIGDAYRHFGKMSSDESNVHVLNTEEGKLFEVIREKGSYSETILGIDPDVYKDISDEE